MTDETLKSGIIHPKDEPAYTNYPTNKDKLTHMHLIFEMFNYHTFKKKHGEAEYIKDQSATIAGTVLRCYS